jgi:hypothetical protein
MARKTKLSIMGRGETDSPSVDDFLNQVRDYYEILEGVERAIDKERTNAIVWRVVNATTNSPIAIELEAYPKEFAVDVSSRADVVVRHAARGLNQLREKRERPPYFDDKVLQRAERLFERITNGLDRTFIEFGSDLPTLDLTRKVARQAAENTRAVREPPEKPYEEWGSIEGTAQSIDRDARGNLILGVHHRLTGDSVKCVVSGEAAEVLADHKIRDVWRHRRLLVYGKLHYKGLGKLTQVEAIRVRFVRDRSELPDIDDIQDENFTDGMRSEEYLAKLRDGDIN